MNDETEWRFENFRYEDEVDAEFVLLRPRNVDECSHRATVQGRTPPKIGGSVRVAYANGNDLPLTIVAVEQIDAETWRIGCLFGEA